MPPSPTSASSTSAGGLSSASTTSPARRRIETPILRIDPSLEGKQVDRLAATRAGRDGTAVGAALSELKRAAAGEANLMEPILAAAREQVTEGEMIAALQEVFGTYTESPVF